ncbi:hypothetical protein [Treponema sp. Marseille-Q4130]|uniref:hypothetical protein n=1 Tax=Treponema sp. Marseille-Q4130 TaxID=2766702 RepID=UPI00165228F4|nr:hypothetical protein [Treponema sp. Marseille-Q4130]MBC6720089.1 hypothetical protein [Treponema sp. Marseille-Q4130]
MNEIFKMDNDLSIRGDVLNDGMETKYDFAFCDKESKQFGKVTIRCENFQSIDENSDRKIKAAAELCNDNLADWWKVYKAYADLENRKEWESLLPLAISTFYDMQKSKNINT